MSHLPITVFDIVVAAIVLISALLAVGRGFAREVMSLVSWIGAGVIAWLAYPHVRPLLGQAIGTGMLADLATAVVVFLVPLIVLRLTTGMLAETVAGLGLGGLDRVAGLAFGLARGLLIVCAAYLLATYIIEPKRFPAWVTEAALEPPVRGGAKWLAGLLPVGVENSGRATVQSALDRARQGRAEGQPAPAPTPADAKPTAQPGYGRESREQMNKLIDQVH